MGNTFSECYIQQKLTHGQREDNNEHTKTTQTRQYNSTKQDKKVLGYQLNILKIKTCVNE